jgi:hypothetical protein
MAMKKPVKKVANKPKSIGQEETNTAATVAAAVARAKKSAYAARDSKRRDASPSASTRQTSAFVRLQKLEQVLAIKNKKVKTAKDILRDKQTKKK